MTRWKWALCALALGACSQQSTLGEPITIQTLAPPPTAQRTTLPPPTAPLLDMVLVECAPLGAVGTFTNRTTQVQSVFVEVRYFAEAGQRGTVVWTDSVPLRDVAPGATALWGSHSYGKAFASCEAHLGD